MYSYIKGVLEEIDDDQIVVDNHGIGYRIRVSERILTQLPPRGEMVKIYTYLNVREDEFSLFGFLSRDDVKLFRMLIKVSGIGPKGGMALLSALSADQLRFAIAGGDEKTIAKAPGIGKKTAQRLIIELKDKIDLGDTLTHDLAENADLPQMTVQRSEAAEALAALGYSAYDASRVLSEIDIDENMSTESILKEALKRLAIV